MKRRLLALLLAAAMCFSLVACGGEKETSSVKTLAQELGYGYLSEYSDLQVELDWIGTVSSASGMLYFSGDYYDEENGTSATKLYQVDPASGSTTEIPVPQMENSEGVSEYIQSISVCPDGSGYWLMMEHYTYQVYEDLDGDGIMPLEETGEVASATAVADVAEEAVAETGEEAPAQEADSLEEPVTEDAPADMAPVEGDFQEENYYLAQKYDMSGNMVAEINMTEATADMDYFYPQYVAQNGAGDLLISCDSGILVFGSDGTQKPTIEMNDQWVQSMVASGNGTVVASYYNTELSKSVVARVENGALSQPLDITGFPETGNMSLYPGDGDTVLINDGTILYSLDVNTGAATKLLSWLDSDINGSNLSGIAYSGADKVVVLMSDFGRDGFTYEMGMLTKTPVEEIPERTILTLGGTYLNDSLQNAVIDFNRTNDTYRITFVDYGDYNTNEDYTLAEQQLDRDVISGNSPDIISLSSGHAQKYIAKGALADLSALMEKDGEMSTDDLLSGPLKAFMSEGKLYGMPSTFTLQSLKASRKLVGDITSWDMATFGEIVKNLDESVEIMKYTSQESFLSQMVAQNLGSFVDYGKATCSFDSQEFKDLMAIAACFPTQEELEAANTDESGEVVYYYDDPDGEIQRGELLTNDQYISDSSSVKYFYNLYTEENGFVNLGYPQNEGNGAIISVGNSLAISSKCKNQEGAWAFIKNTLSDKNQKDIWNLPVTVSAFDSLMAEAMEKPYYMDGDEKVYYDDVMYIGDTEYTVEPLTQEQVNEFKEYINGAEISGTYDTDIMDIVTEESGAYFAGDKTADEVATLIQNRVTIYLGETS